MTKKRLFIVLLCLFVFSMPAFPGKAQEQNLFIGYGETASGYLSAGQSQAIWSFSGAEREMVRITVRRIGGIFSPQVRLLDAAGTPLETVSHNSLADGDEIVLSTGLPVSGDYRIEVTSATALTDRVDNPNEYSLTLRRIGSRRAPLIESFTTIGTGSELPPDLASSTLIAAEDNPLGIVLYNTSAPVREPDTAQLLNGYTVASLSGNRQITVSNAVPIARGISSLSIVDAGLGFTSLPSAVFFTDHQSMTVSTEANGLLTVILPGTNPQTIVTDFYGILSIQAMGELVVVRMVNGQRLILSGTLIDLRQRARQGANDEPVFEIKLDDNRFVNTDLAGWHTLVYLNQQLRILYGDDSQFITDQVRLDVFQDNQTAGFSDITLYDALSTDVLSPTTTLAIDWRGGLPDTSFGENIFGDVELSGDSLHIIPLDGRDILENLSLSGDRRAVSDVLIEQGAVRIHRADSTYRLSLPDGTDILSQPPVPADTTALPYAATFVPLGLNNLGSDPFPSMPAHNTVADHLPVNPVNGNFYYAVQDYYIPSHTLELNFERYYNGQADDLTPDYMLQSSYVLGRFGDGWRHSYQYELDITHAPFGQVTLILPQGTRHIFNAQEDGVNYQSSTLLSWLVERVGGLLGNWVATTPDGIQYHFDRAGRLQYISDAQGLTLTFSPVPREYQESGQSSGVFIIEPYGRRLEIYNNDAGLISMLRDTLARRITYRYDGDKLIGVQYMDETQTASYTYNQDGRLVAFNDVYSPYHQRGVITYSTERRVILYVENPDGSQPRRFEYAYDNAQRITTRTTQVTALDGTQQLRSDSWQYDEQYLVTSYTSPRAEFNYSYSYDRDTNLLNAVRQPDMTTFRFVYDDRGFLTQFRDPIYTNNGYNFSYEIRGSRRLLQTIDYPNGARESFVYDDTLSARLLEHRWLVSSQPTLEYIQRYTYDEWGRIATITNPGSSGEDVVTAFTYDDFGYVSAVQVGDSWQVGFRYDLLGRLRSITDGNGNSYSLDWRSTQNLLSAVYGPEGFSSTYNYDAFGRLIEWNDHGNVNTYAYDDLNHVVGMTNAAGQHFTYTYDESSNLLSRSDPQSRTYLYTYDALNNLTSETTPGGLTSTYEYGLEAGGSYTYRRATDPAGNITFYRYDALGRLKRITLINDETQRAYEMTYDSMGNMTGLTEEFTGRNLRVAYNLIGQVLSSAIENTATSYTYDLAGNLLSVTDPSGLVTTYTHDLLGNVTAASYSDGTQMTYRYDGNRNLLSSFDTLGRETSYAYDALNRVTAMVEPGNRVSQYSYDDHNNLVSVTDPLGNTRTATYDSFGHIASLMDALGNVTTYNYDDLGRLTSVNAPLSFTTQYAYNIDDRIVSITQPSGRQTIFDYDVLGRLTSVTDALGHTYVYSYNQFGSLASVTDPLGNVAEYGWSNGRPGTYTDGNGRGYQYNPDMIGRVVTIRDATDGGVNLLFNYDSAGRITEINAGTDRLFSNSRETRRIYQYDESHGWLETYTDPAGLVWTLTRDAVGSVIGLQDPNGILTNYEYDVDGNVVRIVHAAGTESQATEQFAYDANGNRVQYVAADGAVTQYRYDANNQLIEIREAVGTSLERVFAYEYDAAGHVTRAVDPLGRETVYRYDPFGNLTRVILSRGQQTLEYQYIYDLMGNLTGMVLSGSQQINMSYDAVNRRVRYVDAANGVWAYTYDSAGNLTQVSDPLGNVTRYEYDVYNRLSRLIYPDGAAVTLIYDERGNFQSVVAPTTGDIDPERTDYTIDAAGNLITITDNAGGDDPARTHLQYDAFGRVTQRETPDGSVTLYRYDELGRLVEVTYPDLSTQTRAYDAAGRLTSITAPTGVISFAYDTLGRLVTAQAGTTTVAYTYDAVDNLLSRDAGNLGAVVYTYDTVDRPVRIQYGDQTIDLVYDGNGWRTQLVRSNGVATNYTYDANGRPQVITHIGPNNALLDGFSYIYDAVGNLTRADRVDSWSVLYNYNASRQIIDERWLSVENDARYTLSLNYDNSGNIIDTTRDGSRTLYVYNEQNQLVGEIRNYNPTEVEGTSWLPVIALAVVGTFISRRHWRRWVWASPVAMALLIFPVVRQQNTTPTYDVTYSYSENGSLQQITYTATGYQLNFTYDYENRLNSIVGTREDGTPINALLTYDALGRLAQWQNNSESYQLIYDGETVIATQALPSGQQTRYFTPFPAEVILSSVDNASPLWTLQDAAHYTRRLTDDGGSPVDNQNFEFNVFGQPIAPYGQTPVLGTTPIPWLAGDLYDPNTELYLEGSRAYDPAINRFLQRSQERHFPRQTLYGRFNPPVNGEVQPDIAYRYLYDGTFAPLILDAAQPQTLQGSLLSDTMTPLNTARLQAEENVRLLRLAQRFSGLSPVAVDFLNPLLETSSFMTGANSMLDHYTSGGGWLPHNVPDPLALPDSMAPIWDAQSLLSQGEQPLLAFPTMPDPVTSTIHAEVGIPEMLQEVQIMTGLLPEVETLSSFQLLVDLPAHPIIETSVPQPRSVPPALIELYNLYRPPLWEDRNLFHP